MEEAEGIPPTASTASAGLGISYLGEHIYSYSGEIVMSSSLQTMLEFKTGAGYIVSKMFLSGAVAPGGSGVGTVTSFMFELNDISMLDFKLDTNEEDSPMSVWCPLLIPPFTKVQLTCVSLGASSNHFTTACIIGRVYDA